MTTVTITDPETGESETVEIKDNYVLICDGNAQLAHSQTYKNGTTVLTIKRPRKDKDA